MSETTYRQAINSALVDAMEADGDVFALGEDIAAAGGAFKVTEGLLDRFGSERVLDTPISEQAIIGCAIGAATQGLRPVAELMFSDFAAVCFDQIVNELAKYRYMTDGQVTLPVTIRLSNGGGGGFGAQHSQCAENWFLNFSGLKIAVPATPGDAYGLLRAAVEDPNPVLFFEHKGLFNLKGDLPADPPPVELGRAAIVRSGTDVTVVATQAMLHRALAAADALQSNGPSVEVIDPRTLFPMDCETIAESVDRTNHLVVVQEAPAGGSWGDTLITAISQKHFEALDAPPRLLAADNTPIPYAAPLEEAWMPSTDTIAAAVRDSVEY